MEVISCKKAKELGLKHYFTGKKCIHGHLTYRFVSNQKCKDCLSEDCKKYYYRHKEYMLTRNKKWYKDNREKHVAKNKRWAENNPEKYKTMVKETYQRKYAKHRDKVIFSNQKRKILKRTRGNFTIEEWNVIKEKYNYTCLCCGKKEPEIKLTQDHIVPLFHGGLHEKENIQPLCKSCNCKKFKSTIDYRPI